MFAYAAKDHCRKYGTKQEHFAKIASKNRTQGTQNPRAATQVSSDNNYACTCALSVTKVTDVSVQPWL